MTQTCPAPRPTVATRPKVTRDEALRRWPRIVAHVICRSLGYATPTLAAKIVAAFKNGELCYCEWLGACYQPAYSPDAAVREAIRFRHHHRGYMAHYPDALHLVVLELAGQLTDPLHKFASWF
jgi:hypothetical protein